jgi:hypothetical protein
LKYAAADVLAAAYRGDGRAGSGPRKGRPMLVHSVELDADGYPARVLCGRVDVDHMTVDAGDPARAPTCALCARRLAIARLSPTPNV